MAPGMPPDGPDTRGREFARLFMEKPGMRERSPHTVALLLEAAFSWSDGYRSLSLPDRLAFRSAAERELKRARR